MKVFFRKITVRVLVVAILAVFAIVVLPWLPIAIGSVFTPSPPAPQITYGEFPFRLEYEISGERFTIEDTYICEYDGVGWNEGQGKFRKWKGYLANSREEGVLLKTDGTRKIYCYIGDAEYYMGDEKYPEQRPLTPRIYTVGTDYADTAVYTQEQLLEKYNIRLLNWDFTDPTVNSFDKQRGH